VRYCRWPRALHGVKLNNFKFYFLKKFPVIAYLISIMGKKFIFKKMKNAGKWNAHTWVGILRLIRIPPNILQIWMEAFFFFLK
jgi:hypothetical protein